MHEQAAGLPYDLFRKTGELQQPDGIKSAAYPIMNLVIKADITVLYLLPEIGALASVSEYISQFPVM